MELCERQICGWQFRTQNFRDQIKITPASYSIQGWSKSETLSVYFLGFMHDSPQCNQKPHWRCGYPAGSHSAGHCVHPASSHLAIPSGHEGNTNVTEVHDKKKIKQTKREMTSVTLTWKAFFKSEERENRECQWNMIISDQTIKRVSAAGGIWVSESRRQQGVSGSWKETSTQTCNAWHFKTIHPRYKQHLSFWNLSQPYSASFEKAKGVVSHNWNISCDVSFVLNN